MEAKVNKEQATTATVLRNELRRFSNVFLSYTKLVIVGMSLAALFLFFYAGVRARYLSLEILGAISATVLSFIAAALGVFFVRMRLTKAQKLDKKMESIELALSIAKLDVEKQRVIRESIVREISALTPYQLGTLTRPRFASRVYSSAHLLGFFTALAFDYFLMNFHSFRPIDTSYQEDTRTQPTQRTS